VIEKIYGPPGTGKTTTLMNRLKELTKDMDPSLVFAASLTRTAAAELASRVVDIPQQNCGTLHALSWRTIKAHRGKSPKLVYGALDRFSRDSGFHVPSRQRSVVSAAEYTAAMEHDPLNEYEVLRSRMTPRDQWPWRIEIFASKFEPWKQANGFMDFTDLIEEARYLDPGVVALLYDEAQDGSALEFDLLWQWHDKYLERLVIAGDDDQALYRFRGGDAGNLINFPADKETVLDFSYRCPVNLVEESQRLTANIIERAPKVYVGHGRHRAQIVDLNDTLRTPDPIVRLARHHAESGRVMILASCGYMLGDVIKHLLKEGVPFHNRFRPKEREWNPLNYHTRKTSALDAAKAWLLPVLNGYYIEDSLDDLAVLYRWQPSLFRDSQDPAIGGKLSIGSMDSWNVSPLRLDALRLVAQTQTDIKQLDYCRAVVANHGVEALWQDPAITVGTIHSVKGGEAETVIVAPDKPPAANTEWRTSWFGKDDAARLMYVAYTRAINNLFLLKGRFR
jgi:DNA helicase-2/ATP-dependent DNA helicase PcrA